MTEIMLVAMQDGSFRPNALQDAQTVMRRWKPGELAVVEVRKPRHGAFHRKYFALINFLYEYWEPGEVEYKGIPVVKNIDKFREDITIASGFSETYCNAITGELRLKAKSISFAAMDEDEFGRLYSAAVDIGLKRILPHTFTGDDVQAAVERELTGFL